MTFADVRGSEGLVEEVTKTLNLFLAYRTFNEQMGGTPRKAILFEGPPGTGKTYMAKAMASEAGVPFLFVSSSAFQSMFYGQTNRKIRAYFKELRRQARREGGAIGFIEELDAIGGARGRGPPRAKGCPASSTSCSSSCSRSSRHRGRSGCDARPSTPATPGSPRATASASRRRPPPTSW